MAAAQTDGRNGGCSQDWAIAGAFCARLPAPSRSPQEGRMPARQSQGSAEQNDARKRTKSGGPAGTGREARRAANVLRAAVLSIPMMPAAALQESPPFHREKRFRPLFVRSHRQPGFRPQSWPRRRLGCRTLKAEGYRNSRREKNSVLGGLKLFFSTSVGGRKGTAGEKRREAQPFLTVPFLTQPVRHEGEAFSCFFFLGY